MADTLYPDRQPQPPDFDAVRLGSIAWSADEFWAVAEHEMHLIDVPQDDWDRKPLRVTVDVGRGSETYRFNPDVRLNQMMSFMLDRYRDFDATTKASHMNRYMTIKEFTSVNHERLVVDGFIQVGGEDGQEAVASALIEVLVEAPFATTYRNAGGHETPTFDYAAIAAEARRRMDAEEVVDGADGDE